MRFATQFDFGSYAYLETMEEFYIGFRKVDDGVGMISYVLCLVGIIFAATLAQMNQDILGIEDQDEIDRESISEAIKRFLQFSNIESRYKAELEEVTEDLENEENRVKSGKSIVETPEEVQERIKKEQEAREKARDSIIVKKRVLGEDTMFLFSKAAEGYEAMQDAR